MSDRKQEKVQFTAKEVRALIKEMGIDEISKAVKDVRAEIRKEIREARIVRTENFSVRMPGSYIDWYKEYFKHFSRNSASAFMSTVLIKYADQHMASYEMKEHFGKRKLRGPTPAPKNVCEFKL
jgi:hypothetical protein